MIRLCITSQTPPVRPVGEHRPAPSAVWQAGRDYVPQVGGVVPMMSALLRSSLGHWVAPNPRWVALGAPELPSEFATSEGYTVETVALEPQVRSGYTRFKDALWRSFHGPSGLEPFALEDYSAYVEYNHRTAQHLLRHRGAYDLFYVNDFQLLLVGGLVGAAAPAILRWHIPLEFRGYPEPVRRFFLRSMEGFDAIVVSTRGALEELIRFGFRGRAFQVYPYVDPAVHRPAPPGDVRRFRERFGLGERPYVLSVGRMDPVKRQDLLLQAFSRLRHRFPEHRLVLVGGGSFSTQSLPGADRRSKDAVWLERIQTVLRSERLQESVVVAGTLSNDELGAAYDGACALVHPAPWEGFGLVAVEAWMHGLPVIVSRGAGVAELVTDGVNGFTVPPGSVAALSARMAALFAHPDRAEQMGESGRLTARRCHVGLAARRLREIFQHTIKLYKIRGQEPPALLPS
ncbi:MAG: glycosyltransferase family 4 protein [Thermoplasmata archaeon]